MSQCFACFGIETGHEFEVVLLLKCKLIGGIGLENVLQGVAALLNDAVVCAAIQVSIVAERRCGKHVVGRHSAAVSLRSIVDIAEGIVEIDGHIFQRIKLCSEVGTQISRREALAIAGLNVGNCRAERLAFVVSIGVPAWPTQQIEPRIILP